MAEVSSWRKGKQWNVIGLFKLSSYNQICKLKAEIIKDVFEIGTHTNHPVLKYQTFRKKQSNLSKEYDKMHFYLKSNNICL